MADFSKRDLWGPPVVRSHLLPHCQPRAPHLPMALIQDALGSGQPGHEEASGNFLCTVSIGPWGLACHATGPQNPQKAVGHCGQTRAPSPADRGGGP